jgi:hypothetical protein
MANGSLPLKEAQPIYSWHSIKPPIEPYAF